MLAIARAHRWSSSDIRRVLDHMSDLGIRKVVAQGYSPGVAGFLSGLRRAAPEIRIYGVWHGALAAWCHQEERDYARQFLELASNGVYDRIHFMKRGMHLLHAKAHAPLLPNPVPFRAVTRSQPAMAVPPYVCLFGSWNNAWKNMYANVLGVSSSGLVEKVLTYAPMDFEGAAAAKARLAHFGSRDEHFSLLSTVDLVLNATIVDCHPMLELEGLATGTPALRADLDLDFGQDHEYERRFTLRTPHNLVAFVERIEELSKASPAELADITHDYGALVTRTSFERYADFLEG